MNPLLSSFLSALFRWALTGAGAWFVQKGILNEAQMTEMIAGAVLAILALIWSLWSKYRSKLELFTVAAMPKGTTLDEAKQSIYAGVSASANTGAGDVPRLVNGTGDGTIKNRAWLLPLLLVAGPAVAVPACSLSLMKPPAVSTEAQAKLHDAAIRTLAGLEIGGIVMRDSQAVVSDLAGVGVLPLTVRTEVNKIVIEVNKVIQDVVTKIERVVNKIDMLATLDTLKEWAGEAVAAFESLAAALEAQADTRVSQAGQFVRQATGAIKLLLGLPTTQEAL